MNEQIDIAIIGAGHAGLTMSYSLNQIGREHLILERGRVGERWRSERWDSFHFQFPNWTIELPGYKYQVEDPDDFAPGQEVVRFLDGYADFINAPVRCGVSVESLEQVSPEGRFLIQTQNGSIEAETVVIATGPFQRASIPSLRTAIPPLFFRSIHASTATLINSLPALFWSWAQALRAAKSRKI
jgi:putative flavoprotein involved in K+ transport